MNNLLRWYDKEFREEIGRLCFGLRTFCYFWGMIFGNIKAGKNTLDEETAIALAFTEKEFPIKHPELKTIFRNVIDTLFVAVVKENNKLIIRPEINTIYTYHSKGKHDLIFPVISALAKDCLAYARSLQNQLMN